MSEFDGLKDLLKRNLEASEESLKILKKMHRAAIMGRFFWVVKWLFIIGVSLGAYYYLEPYLQSLMSSLNTISSGINEIKGAGENLAPTNLPIDFLEKLK
ncbi:hypothetical protein KKD04_00770, partial [Patescibacteria group bacterium]|nr:hypothetical protein [Patescibacteria group bacterium]